MVAVSIVRIFKNFITQLLQSLLFKKINVQCDVFQQMLLLILVRTCFKTAELIRIHSSHVPAIKTVITVYCFYINNFSINFVNIKLSLHHCLVSWGMGGQFVCKPSQFAAWIVSCCFSVTFFVLICCAQLSAGSAPCHGFQSLMSHVTYGHLPAHRKENSHIITWS